MPKPWELGNRVPPNHPFVHRVFHYFHHPFWGYPGSPTAFNEDFQGFENLSFGSSDFWLLDVGCLVNVYVFFLNPRKKTQLQQNKTDFFRLLDLFF